MANTFNTAVSDYKESLAKDLGYSNYKEYQQANKKGYSGGTKQRLEQGAGFGEAFAGGIGEGVKGIGTAMNPKNIAKKAYMNFFSGDDIFSAYMRGRLAKKPKAMPKPKEQPKEVAKPAETPKMEFMESYDKKLVGRDKKGKFTKLTEEEQWAQQRKYGLTKLTALSPTPVGGKTEGLGNLAGVAKDIMIIRNAISTLLDFEKEGKEQGKRAEQTRFLQEQDSREAALEAKNVAPIQVTTEGGAETKKSGGGIMGFLKNITSLIFSGIGKAFGLLFSPKFLFSIFKKLFAFVAVVGSIFVGFKAGFEEFGKSGSLGKALAEGLTAVLNFLTLGLLSKETLDGVKFSIESKYTEIKNAIVGKFYDMKDWMINNIGIPRVDLFTVGGETYGFGPWYPFKDNPSSAEAEKSERPAPDPMPEAPAAQAESAEPTASGVESGAMPSVKDEKASATETPAASNNEAASITPQKVSDNVAAKTSPLNMGMAKSGDMQSKLSNFMGDNMGKLSPEGFGGAASLAETFSGLKVDRDAMNKGLQSDMGKADAFMKGGGLEAAFGQMGERSKDVSGSLEGAQSAISNKIKAGGVTPDPVTPFGAATSGQTISAGSTEVESGQRSEMMQDSGSLINAPQIKNQSTNSSKSPPPAEVLNFEFADALMST